MDNQATGSSSTIKPTLSLDVDTPLSSALSSPDTASVAGTPISGTKGYTPFHLTEMETESSMTSLSSSASPPIKRRLSNASEDRAEASGLQNKKPKVSAGSAGPTSSKKGSAKGSRKTDKKKATVKSPLKSAEYPNGWFYCHQCNKKRDISRKSCTKTERTPLTDPFYIEGLYCTMKDMSSHILNARCKAKYCVSCLKNRYNKTIDELKIHNGPELTRKERERHIPNQPFLFTYVLHAYHHRMFVESPLADVRGAKTIAIVELVAEPQDSHPRGELAYTIFDQQLSFFQEFDIDSTP